MGLVAAGLVVGMSVLSVSQESIAITDVSYEVIDGRAASERQAVPGDEVRITAIISIEESYTDSSPISVEFYYYGDLEGHAGSIGSDQLLPVPGIARSYSVSVTWYTDSVSRDRYAFRVRAADLTADSDVPLVMLQEGVAVMSYSDTSEAPGIKHLVRLNPTEPGGYNLKGSALIKFTNLGSVTVGKSAVYYCLSYKVFTFNEDPEDVEYRLLQEGTLASTQEGDGDPIIEMFMSADVPPGDDGRIVVEKLDVGALVKRLYEVDAELARDVFSQVDLLLPDQIGQTAYLRLLLEFSPSEAPATDTTDSDSPADSESMKVHLPTLRPDGQFVVYTDIEPFEIAAAEAGWTASMAPLATTTRFLFDAVPTDRDRIYVTNGNALLAMTQYGTVLDPGSLRIPSEGASSLSAPLSSYDANNEEPLVIVSDGLNRIYAYSDKIPLGGSVENAVLSKEPVWAAPAEALDGGTIVGPPVLLEDARPGLLGAKEVDLDLTSVLVASTVGLHLFNGQFGTEEWQSTIAGINWEPLLAHKSDRIQHGFDRSLVFVATAQDLYYREVIQGARLGQVPIPEPSTGLVGAYISAASTDDVDAYVIYLASGESVRAYVVSESSRRGKYSYSVSEEFGSRQLIQGAARFVSLKLFATQDNQTHRLFLLTELGEIYVLKYTASVSNGSVDLQVSEAGEPWTLTKRVVGPLDGLVLSEAGPNGFEAALFVSTTDGLLQGVRFTEISVAPFGELPLEIWGQELESGFAFVPACDTCALGPPRVMETPYGPRLFIGSADGVLRVFDLSQYVNDGEAGGAGDQSEPESPDAEGSV